MTLETIKGYGLTAAVWVAWAGRAVIASVMAFFKSPQVWLAGVLCAFLGYYGGYLMLAGKVASIHRTNAALAHANSVLTIERNKWKSEVASLSEVKVEAPPHSPVAAPAPVRPVARKPKATTVAVETPWWLR